MTRFYIQNIINSRYSCDAPLSMRVYTSHTLLFSNLFIGDENILMTFFLRWQFDHCRIFKRFTLVEIAISRAKLSCNNN